MRDPALDDLLHQTTSAHGRLLRYWAKATRLRKDYRARIPTIPRTMGPLGSLIIESIESPESAIPIPSEGMKIRLAEADGVLAKYEERSRQLAIALHSVLDILIQEDNPVQNFVRVNGFAMGVLQRHALRVSVDGELHAKGPFGQQDIELAKTLLLHQTTSLHKDWVETAKRYDKPCRISARASGLRISWQLITRCLYVGLSTDGSRVNAIVKEIDGGKAFGPESLSKWRDPRHRDTKKGPGREVTGGSRTGEVNQQANGKSGGHLESCGNSSSALCSPEGVGRCTTTSATPLSLLSQQVNALHIGTPPPSQRPDVEPHQLTLSVPADPPSSDSLEAALQQQQWDPSATSQIQISRFPFDTHGQPPPRHATASNIRPGSVDQASGRSIEGQQNAPGLLFDRALYSSMWY